MVVADQQAHPSLVRYQSLYHSVLEFSTPIGRKVLINLQIVVWAARQIRGLNTQGFAWRKLPWKTIHSHFLHFKSDALTLKHIPYCNHHLSLH